MPETPQANQSQQKNQGNTQSALPLTSTSETISSSLIQAFNSAAFNQSPYPNWFANDCLPEDILNACINLPFETPELSGPSGRRELHNKTRQYFDTENQNTHPACQMVTEALQSSTITKTIENKFNIDLSGTYLRVEYAQDTDGFWLEPHTDLGVKTFTMLLYISTPEQHKALGTDIYDKDKQHLGSSPFLSNSAFIFIPSDDTYHGFEKRPIEDIRKSIIINYVTDEWRAREQLAYPNQPIG